MVLAKGVFDRTKRMMGLRTSFVAAATFTGGLMPSELPNSPAEAGMLLESAKTQNVKNGRVTPVPAPTATTFPPETVQSAVALAAVRANSVTVGVPKPASPMTVPRAELRAATV